MQDAALCRPSAIDALLGAPSSGAGVLRISLEGVPERQRPDVYRELFGRSALRLEIDPLRDMPFEADATMQALPGVHLFAGRVHGSCNRQTRAAAAHAVDDFALMMNLGGPYIVVQRGRDLVLGDGESTLVSCSEPFSLTHYPPGDVLAIRVPRKRLAPLVNGIDECVMRPIPRHNLALGMLRDYIGMAWDDRTIATGELRDLAVAHIYDLVAVALGAARDVAATAQGRGLRAARLHAIKEDIARNLKEGDLSVTAIAGRHGCTPRFVQRLFETEGTTFTDYVLGQRLASAHKSLNDPRRADEKIASIAYETGFSDLSYFNRVFRRRYGAAPSDVRARAQADTAALT
jgi:AraC-like DNA-binding protein